MATNTSISINRPLAESSFFRRRDPNRFGLFLDGYFTARAYLQKASINSVGLKTFLVKGSKSLTKPGLYIIPELTDQYGSLADNIIPAFNQRITYFGQGLFRIGHQKVIFDTTLNYHIDIVGYDVDRNVKIGITTDPAKHSYPAERILNSFTNEYADLIWQSADELGFSIGDDGFILINNFSKAKLSFDSLEFFASFNYQPIAYEYMDLELNPELTTTPVTDYKIVFFIRPVYRYTDHKERTVYYILVDQDNEVVYSSYWGLSAGMKYESPYLFEAAFEAAGLKVLGEAYTSVLSLSDVEIKPISKLGGGIKEEYWNDLTKENSRFSWYTEIGNWDGETGPIGNTLLLTVPHYLLKEFGGNLTFEDISKLSKTHIASGTNVLIELKGLEIFTEAEWLNNQVSLTWTYVGSLPYKIYYRADNMSDFSLYTTIYSSNTNTYTISNLDSNRTYEFYVTAIAYGVETIPSNIAVSVGGNSQVFSEVSQISPTKVQKKPNRTKKNSPPNTYLSNK